LLSTLPGVYIYDLVLLLSTLSADVQIEWYIYICIYIYIEEVLTFVQEELIKTNRVKPSPQTLTCLLEKVLRLNNFTFNDEQFIQIKETAMGTRVAPNFANVYMGRYEENFVYKTEWSNYVILWVRFIDDIFLICKGDIHPLTKFTYHLNNAAPSIKFTQ